MRFGSVAGSHILCGEPRASARADLRILERFRYWCSERPPSFPPWQGGMNAAPRYKVSESVLALGLALAMGVGPAVRAEPPALLGERIARIADLLPIEMAKQDIPGMSVAVVMEDRLVWSQGFGFADVENRVPATRETVYRIGAVSKMVTAVGILQLIQAGKLNLHASVRDYVPELPDPGATITIRHLLAHMSGVRHYKSESEVFNRQHFDKLVDTLAVFKDDPLVVKPGEQFLYSSFAYNLLGLVIERISGETYESYIKKQIFEPLQMKASTVDDLRTIIPHRARGYTRAADGRLRNSAFVDLSIRQPGDGLLSTAEDLARFAMAFHTGRLLDPSIVQVMTTEHKTSGGQASGYGLGCFVRELDGRKIIGHAGVVPQAAAFLLIVPEERVAIVVIANLEEADVNAISLRIARILLGDEPLR
ncbi:MAG: beta-lactamase family protein [Planctomycetes bacterium]|nr:beta-lactamase family protein [Planctomycetota bacterium]